MDLLLPWFIVWPARVLLWLILGLGLYITATPVIERGAHTLDQMVTTSRWWQLLLLAGMLAGCVWAVVDILRQC